MDDVGPNQTGPENTLWEGTPSTRVAIIKPLMAIGFFGGSYFYRPDLWQAASYMSASLYRSRADLAIYAPYVLAFLIIAIFAYGFLVATTTNYVCTSERLIIRKGLVIRSEDEIELYRVIDIVQSSNILQMLLAVGSVTIKNTDQTGTITMPSIAKASEVRNLIRVAAERCKARRVRVFAE